MDMTAVSRCQGLNMVTIALEAQLKEVIVAVKFMLKNKS